MESLKNEVLEGIKKEEYPLPPFPFVCLIWTQAVEDDSDDEFFTKRAKEVDDADDFNEYIENNVNEEKKERVKSFIDMTPEDAKERFLHDYIVNMKWKEKDDDFIPQ